MSMMRGFISKIGKLFSRSAKPELKQADIVEATSMKSVKATPSFKNRSTMKTKGAFGKPRWNSTLAYFQQAGDVHPRHLREVKTS